MHLDAEEEGEDQSGVDNAKTPLPQNDGAADPTSATGTSGVDASAIATDSRHDDAAQSTALTAEQEA